MAEATKRKKKGYYSGRLLQRLEENLNGFDQLKRTDQLLLSRLFHNWYFSKYQHSKYNGYNFISAENLRRMFGQTRENGGLIDRFHVINNRYGWVTVKDDYYHSSENPQLSYTRAYKISPDVHAVLDRYFDQLLRKNPDSAYIVDSNGRLIRQKRDSAIFSRDMNGNTAKTENRIRFAIEVNTDSLYRALRYAKELQDSRHFNPIQAPDVGEYSPYFDDMDPERLDKAVKQLADLHSLAFNSLFPAGYIPQLYVEAPSGRLYGQGISLQSVVSEVRYVALQGMDLTEHDFANCHYSILAQLAARNGCELDNVKAYIRHKNGFRKHIADQAGITIAQAKTALLMLIYGAKTNKYPKNAIPEMIGVKAADRLYQVDEFSLIAKDIKQARNVIVENAEIVYPSGQKTVRNVMGKTLKASASKREILAHILQGYEAKLLNIVLDAYSDKIVVLQHDGWIAEPGIDTGYLESKIEDETGLLMKIESDFNYSDI